MKQVLTFLKSIKGIYAVATHTLGISLQTQAPTSCA